VLTRVGGARRARENLDQIREAIAMESGSFWELFRPGIRVALLIAVGLAVLQQVTGINAVLYYAPGIFRSAGADVTAAQALLQTVALQAVNLLFTLVAIQVVDRGGRKPLLLVTSAAMGVSLVLLGGAFQLDLAPGWIFAFTLCYVASFGVAMGPVVWVVLSEIFPTRTRGRAMAIATVTLWAANFLITQTVPWMFNHLGKAGTVWIYAAMCLVAFVFVGALIPETKGKTLEEIERAWLKQ
jgi:MFS family permease